MSISQLDEEAIFCAARNIESPAGRAEYLREACGTDQALFKRVTSLLQAHGEASRFLEAPVISLGDTGSAVVIAETPGMLIGPYKLLEQIGEGGMGLVFMAEQEQPMRRLVALKIIKPGLDTRQVIARFEAERQALAMMNHPNIAKVLDAGATGERKDEGGRMKDEAVGGVSSDSAFILPPSSFASGRPYFVMELVKGLPITDFCDQHKLATRERLKLFITVCQAIQHAHQKGLIHRDIKPSNVLVEMHDVTPVPKVIDFGVAKAMGQQLTEKTLHTGFSQMVGTPMYMSPEQAGQSSIDVDTRSDVYSLGVLLYEMLTGHTPFESETLRNAAYDEMRRMIREVDPPRPSARVGTLQAKALATVSDRRQVEPHRLSQQLKGELDWIVMKALEKDRTRRYESATALAADVKRYLDDEPVEACPPSALYRLRKLARRNRAALVTASLVIAALLTGTAVSIWQAVEANTARRAAETNERTAETNQRRADENFRKSLEVVDRMLTRVGAERMSEYARGDTTRIELLRDAIAFYDEFRTQHPDDPELAYTVAAALHRIGSFYSLWSQPRNSAAAYEKAIAVLEEHAAEPADTASLTPWERRMALLVDCYHRLAELGTSVKVSRLEQALGRAAELSAMMRRVIPEGREPRALAARTQFVTCKFYRGWKSESELIAVLHKTIAEQKAILGEPGVGANDRIQLVQSLIFLGEILKDTDAAEEVFLEAEYVLSPSLDATPAGMERWLLGNVLFHRAQLRSRPDQLAEQEALIRRADPDEMERTIRTRDIGFRTVDGTQIELYERLETILAQTGRTQEALAIQRRLWQLLKLIDRMHQFISYGALGDHCQRLVDGLMALNRIDDALWVCRDSIDALEAGPHLWSAGPSLPGTISAIHSLMGDILRRAGRSTEAEEEMRRSRVVVDQAPEEWRRTLETDPSNWTALAGLARHHLSQREYAEALPYLEREAMVSLGPLVDDLKRQATCHFQLGHYNTALRLLTDCLDWDRSSITWIAPKDVVACPSEEFREGMLEIAARAIQVTNGSVDAYLARAQLLIAMARFEEAQHDFGAAEAAAPRDPRLSAAHNSLGNFLMAKGQLDEANAEFRKAFELQPDDAKTHNSRAWALVASDDPKLRDVSVALEHARRAVELSPNQASFHNTMGVALCRAGQWTDAIEHLETSIKLQKDQASAYDGFFLAMAHWQLGSQKQARQWYDQSVEWMTKNQPQNEELRRFRAEAEELLNDKSGETDSR